VALQDERLILPVAKESASEEPFDCHRSDVMGECWEREEASWPDASAKKGECLGRAEAGYRRPHLYPTHTERD